MLLALKLDQLIWAATRGRWIDEMETSLENAKYTTRYTEFPEVGPVQNLIQYSSAMIIAFIQLQSAPSNAI